MSFLLFGKSNDSLVFIDDVKSGMTKLKCPYCEGALVAKKGKLVSHHFAHKADSCISSANSTLSKYLPLFDFFRLGITSNKQVIELKRLIGKVENNCEDWRFYQPSNSYSSKYIYRSLSEYETNWSSNIYSVKTKYLDLFLELGFLKLGDKIEHNRKVSGKGKAFAIKYTLKEFYLWAKSEFEKLANNTTIEPKELDMIQAIQKRLMNHHLYFIEIKADKETFYKIGITSRSYNERINEIKTFLKKHYKTVKINKVYYLDSVASVEGYFKAKYSKHQFKVGTATEYFKFEKSYLTDFKDEYKTMIKEFHQLALVTNYHKKRISKGIKNRQLVGKRGKEKVNFLDKPKSKEIAVLIQTGMSLRAIEKKTGYSINTIRKVNNVLKQN